MNRYKSVVVVSYFIFKVVFNRNKLFVFPMTRGMGGVIG